MNGEVICEVMLCAYKDLEVRCAVVEDKILRVAVSSMTMNTYQAVEKLFALNNEKIAYCNTKVIIDEALQQMRNKSVLVAHYIHGKTCGEIAKKLNVTERDIELVITRQRQKVLRNILKRYSIETLFSIISDSKWLRHKYSQFINKADGKNIPPLP